MRKEEGGMRNEEVTVSPMNYQNKRHADEKERNIS